MGNKHSNNDDNYIYRKTTLEKITKYIADIGTHELCVILQVKSKDHSNAIDICNYIKHYGYHAEYRWSWSHDTGYTGQLEISMNYTDNIKRSSFNKEYECCCCFLPLGDNKIKKYKCHHIAHKKCKNHDKKCPICEFNQLRRKSLKLENKN